ncbi:MAG: acyl-CoA reductase [Clostridiales bacterium]|nr:acyl-CoA reductase [Clostridiales bacterium]
MNLINGKLYDNDAALKALDELPALILEERKKPFLPPERVIAACGRLGRELGEEHLALLTGMGIREEKARRELEFAREMLSEEYLRERLAREGVSFDEASFVPFGQKSPVRQRLLPLGTLLHIAAGNVDALPVFSVLEGLLTGNVNILKLPRDDGGLSVTILLKLMEYEPAIRGRVFVFDFPSENIDALKKTAAVADAVIVWGGDEAVTAVRRLASPDTRIIEWGHRLSFAYVSGFVTDEALSGLAYNILDTDQLYCSSCQGVFVDTEDENELPYFAERFADILEKKAEEAGFSHDLFIRAQKTLELYTDGLEAEKTGARIIKKRLVSVTVIRDSELAPSHMFGNPWVKPLPRSLVPDALIKHKGRLQTAALLCPESERAELEALLASCGLTRITDGARMSETYCGLPHDGEMPLMRYVRIVSFD